MDIEETRFIRIGRLAMLLAANAVLALGPWLVRMADTGPVAAGFWRLTLAFPLVALLAWREPAGRPALGRAGFLMVIGAGVFFALDLAAWHLGIERTRLGNATLFGNAGSVILIAWGLVAARQMPRVAEIGAICAAHPVTTIRASGRRLWARRMAWRVRRSFTMMLWTSLMVNVGMFLERFIIIVPALMRKGPMTFDFATYRPSPIEITIIGGTIALVASFLLVFSKFFPLIPLWEEKEGGFAWQVGLGARRPLSETSALFLGYRYLGHPTIDAHNFEAGAEVGF